MPTVRYTVLKVNIWGRAKAGFSIDTAGRDVEIASEALRETRAESH